MAVLITMLAVSAAILLGAMSPGPSFVIVARVAMSSSRIRGVCAALGMGIGGAFFALLALLGLQLILAMVPTIYKALQIIGAIYLLFIACKLWMAAPKPLDLDRTARQSAGSAVKALALGLGTQLSNPKTALVYASVFSAGFPTSPSWGITTTLVLIVFAIECGWYSLVAIAFSTNKARRTYMSWKTLIDRLAAGAIGALGLKILADAKLN
jgi:threonine/homoserine/homoserine lactone efflux protein